LLIFSLVKIDNMTVSEICLETKVSKSSIRWEVKLFETDKNYPFEDLLKRNLE
jgi:hypothetical protein